MTAFEERPRSPHFGSANATSLWSRSVITFWSTERCQNDRMDELLGIPAGGTADGFTRGLVDVWMPGSGECQQWSGLSLP